MKVHAVAVNLKSEKPLDCFTDLVYRYYKFIRGAVQQSKKPLRWSGHLGIRFIYHKSVEVYTPTLLHAKISLRTAQSYQHLCF